MNLKPHHTHLMTFIFLVVCLCPKFVFSADIGKSNVELEWESMPDAKKYDLEIKSTKNTFNFKVKEAIWTGKLSPGFFKMRIRGRDKRGVPGEWSEYQEFKVFLDSPEIINPQNTMDIISTSSEKQKVDFKWQNVFSGKKYILVLESLNSDYKKQIETDQEKLTVELPVAQKIKMTVKASNPILTSNPEKDKSVEFSVLGKQLDKPKILPIESNYVREVKWEKSEFAQGYYAILEKFDANEKKFVAFAEDKNISNNEMPFKKEWPGGLYRISVKAMANYRVTSDFSVAKFSVKNGDRSVDAEELAKLRESIERLSGWFAMASYLITSVDYQNLNYDLTNSQTAFSAIGGTARIGLGYVTKKNPWGYFAAAEFSTLKVAGSNDLSYKTIELNSYYKIKPNDSGEFRQTIGLVDKEIPDFTVSTMGTVRNTSNLEALGFRYGVEYWHALTSKIGLQANAHVLPLFKAQKTTNSEPIEPSMSYQLGFLASYRFSKNFTTLFGYAYRVDSLKYKTSDHAPITTSQKANSVQIKGHYLNLFLEYQL